MSSAPAQLFDVPGPRGRMIQRIVAAAMTVVAVAFATLVFWRLADRGNLSADRWTPFLTASVWQVNIIPGLINTLYAAVISIVLACTLGLLLGVGRLSTVAPLRWFCTAFVELFRAVPVLVMMMLSFWGALYYLNLPGSYLPLFGAIVGLTLYNSCIIAELIRSGVHSLPKGQAEAGLSVGLTRGQTLMSIQLPQALTAMLPSLVAQLVVVLKDTALAYQITYPELLRQGVRIGSQYGNIVPAIIVIAGMFILVNFALTRFAEWLERRLSRGGRVAGSATAGPDKAAPADRSADAPAAGGRT